MVLNHDLYYAVLAYLETQRGGFKNEVLMQWLGHKLLKNSQLNKAERQWIELSLKDEMEKLKTVRKSQYAGNRLETQVRMVK